jgi:hypothetical protein
VESWSKHAVDDHAGLAYKCSSYSDIVIPVHCNLFVTSMVSKKSGRRLQKRVTKSIIIRGCVEGVHVVLMIYDCVKGSEKMCDVNENDKNLG